MKIVVIIILLVAGVVAYILIGYTANPTLLYVKKTTVTEGMVVLEDVSFVGSAVWYGGYSANYKDGVLSIKVRARSIKIPGSTGGPFTITISNTYGEISEVRLSGGDPLNDKVIWSRDLE
jgi:hypothetical protein